MHAHATMVSGSLQVMRSVKELTELGLTIVATVHSPTPACFALFDRLLLLVKGRTIYFGPNGELPAPLCWPNRQPAAVQLLL